MTSVENGSFEEEGIDQDRVFHDENNIANEFSCAICQGLLWKPRSCASCQHLFCNQCIRTWLKFNQTSCPFRCSPYEEKRPPPYIHSLLSRLSIRCRNSVFGCTEIVPYYLLEKHQNLECQFPSKQCDVCRKFVLVDDIDQHQQSCIPSTIQCFVCKCLVHRSSYQPHLIECFQQRLDLLIEEMTPEPDDLDTPVNHTFNFLPDYVNQPWLVQLNNRLQLFVAAMPKINLVGLEAVVQARQLNYYNRILAMIRLILFNKSQAAQILILLFCFGIGGIFGCFMCLCSIVQQHVRSAMLLTFSVIILFSGVLGFGLPMLLSSISDTGIILSTFISLILLSSACPELPLDCFQMAHGHTIIAILYFLIFLILKLYLLMIKFCFSFIPSYLLAACLAWTTIFVTFHVRRYSIGTQ
ncbi:unnamed protein product [Rotaria magnacalcarata]|uniref:RING-type domain-containing protein n=1 Tax=Rotaria magnacalcarata TaxID=392030 RepID=A0A816YK09_9BILA|nr:unnamed protein product [Rotaria magnacalcarata]CAF4359373.1 unnamed protein product [Rotaria magnacalcarata]